LRRQREGYAEKRDAGSVQTGILFGYWIITGVKVYMHGKLRHRPKTFMKSPRFKRTVFKFKL
jgi:hypothetical protein